MAVRYSFVMKKTKRIAVDKRLARQGSLGALLDEIGFKPLGRRIRIKMGVSGPRLRIK
jgi:hypothetical protein